MYKPIGLVVVPVWNAPCAWLTYAKADGTRILWCVYDGGREATALAPNRPAVPFLARCGL